MQSESLRQIHPAPPEGDPLLGSIVHGRFHIVRRVAVGGMGSVYRAKSLDSGPDVAIKVVSAAALADPVTVKRFETEVSIIASLEHPATLRLLDYGRLGDGRPFLVTEFLDGVSFEEALLSRPVPPAEILAILIPICDSLQEAHDRGIVHRDLKPENIFLQDVHGQTKVRILDFGIAKLSHTHHTQAGSICGTPSYMSPEQAQGHAADARSDVYGLGVLAYRALVGRPPFEGEEPMSVLLKQIQEAPVPLRKALNWPDFPQEVEKLVMAMLEKSPHRRPSSTTEVKARIQHILRHVPLPTSRKNRPRPSTFAQGAFRLYRVAGAALLGLAASIAVFAWFSQPDETSAGLRSSGVKVDPIDPPASAFEDLPPLSVVPDVEDLEEPLAPPSDSD